MSRAHKIGNILGVFLPVAAFVAALVLLWEEFVGPVDLVVLAAMYVATGLGVTVGFHRLLTHRAFDTFRWLRAAFAVLGSMSVQGPVIHWVADHRKHHAYTDEDGDPHSPHVEGGLRGLWHAHVGWLFSLAGRAEPERYARDLVADPLMRAISRLFPGWVALGLAIPFGVGYAVTGTLRGALIGLLWGGLVRIFLLHHVTFAINSVCHFFGRRRFATDDESGNVFWLALPSFGEAWHHNHHAFPTSAFHGLRRREVDPGGLVIRALERLGLAWNVVRPSRERQAEKALAAAR